MNRCEWASNELMVSYHDEEWGVPLHDERLLFEFLTLEGAQAGLSWSTVLNKRQSYRDAFDEFDVATVAKYDDNKLRSLMANTRIVRNRLKIISTISNAKAFLKIAEETGSFDSYIWGFVGGSALDNQRVSMSDVPATTLESHAMSKDLKRRGFKFVGPTICYAFMQATGMVNDHKLDCFRHGQVSVSYTHLTLPTKA